MQLFYELDRTLTFDAQLMALPPDAQSQVLEKIHLLEADPAPNAKNKKRLVGHKGNICRIRSGDYRVVYTFDQRGRVSLLGVDHRKDVYRKQAWTGVLDDPDFLLDVEVEESLPADHAQAETIRRAAHRATWSTDEVLREQTSWNLPRALDVDFLTMIRVPAEHHRTLGRCQTVDHLLEAAIPEELRDRIFNILVTPNYDQVLTDPRFVLDSIDDFRRMLEGELAPMLLRLDPEQEKHVSWPLAGSGPVLLKGAPGTGKSVVAVYRVRSLISGLRATGVDRPRILYTSYTNALINSAKHLLDGLLGEDACLVDACTADMVIRRLHAANSCAYAPNGDNRTRRQSLDAAQRRMRQGNEQDRRLAHSVSNLSGDYLIDEIDAVIVGRDLTEEEDYLTIPRAGRQVRLTETQRAAVWRLYELTENGEREGETTSYAQTRRTALRGVRNGWRADRYDGVVIDEAQDLQPTAIRLLLELAKSPDRLFLTADSNQSIYGNGFRWRDVHEDLHFRGRPTTLRRTFRSTRQIIEAASAYLVGAELDEEPEAVDHQRLGPKPVAFPIDNRDDEVTEIVAYLREASRAMHVGLTSCAVLVGSEQAGMDIAGRLRRAGVRSEFMKGKDLDLEKPVLTVTTFHSAKGLEFPIVAIAGLDAAPQLGAAEANPESEERRQRDRRVLYVAMTRAMYALLVLLPANAPDTALAPFRTDHWLDARPQSWTGWLDAVGAIEPVDPGNVDAA